MKQIAEWIARRRRRAIATEAMTGLSRIWRYSHVFDYWRHVETGVIFYWNMVEKDWWLADGKGWLIGPAKSYIKGRR